MSRLVPPKAFRHMVGVVRDVVTRRAPRYKYYKQERGKEPAGKRAENGEVSPNRQEKNTTTIHIIKGQNIQNYNKHKRDIHLKI